MELFATDRERLAFLLETDAALDLDFEALEAQAEAAAEEPSPEQRPKYITNYVGSKQKLVDWIWKHTPEWVESAADAFSGSAVVAYMYKTKGLRVLANDRLRYCHHAARAIIENDKVRLSDEDLEALLADNAKAGTFVRDNFKGIFFAKGVHGLIDTIRANVDKLSGFKKDIALFALGKTCMSGKGGFGHFSSSTRYGKREDTPEEFKERLRKNVARINALVFDNGKECKASRKDINDFLPEAKADLAYFDPPYATEFSTTNYEKSYHFVEGLMTYWEGLTLIEDSKTKHYETDHKTVPAPTLRSSSSPSSATPGISRTGSFPTGTMHIRTNRKCGRSSPPWDGIRRCAPTITITPSHPGTARRPTPRNVCSSAAEPRARSGPPRRPQRTACGQKPSGRKPRTRCASVSGTPTSSNPTASAASP